MKDKWGIPSIKKHLEQSKRCDKAWTDKNRTSERRKRKKKKRKNGHEKWKKKR